MGIPRGDMHISDTYTYAQKCLFPMLSSRPMIQFKPASRSIKMTLLLRLMLPLVSIVTICNGLSAEPAVVRPNIISKAEWGGKNSKGTLSNLKINPPPYVVVHHSATPGCTSQALCQAKVRSIQDYHMKNKGWLDIGYNFLVGEDGNVYEGRGWGKQGAHSVNYNSKSIGICVLGTFTNRLPNAAATKAINDLIAWGVANDKIKSNYTLYGHRQTASTECPGNDLYNEIKTWPNWAEITA